MLRTDAADIIDRLKKIYPDWKPGNMEVAIWLKQLTNFDYDAAKAAIDGYYVSEAGHFRKPQTFKFLNACRQEQRKQPQYEPEPVYQTNGPVGAEAKKQAEEIILAGPDTPGKRFLLELQEGKRKGIFKRVPEVKMANV